MHPGEDGSSQDGESVAVDDEGNLVVTGSFAGTMNLGGDDLVSQGSYGLFLAKFSPDGTHLWSQGFGDESVQQGNSVAIDGQGNVLVTGYFEGTMNLGGDDLVSQGGYDLFVAKFSPAGNHLWSKRFGDGSSQDGESVAVDDEGNVVVTGSFGGTMNLGGDDLVSQGNSDLFVVKFGPAGNHIWSQGFGDEKFQWGRVAVDGEGNVLVTGSFGGTMNLGGDDLVSQGSYDLFVAKLSGD